jgi:diadenosine tetraphosphate (Ap4A) HIT family hydrolase
MSDFVLDARLKNDCHILGQLGSTMLLLMDNSLVPWFILVPQVDVTEFHELQQEDQFQLLEHINQVSTYLKQELSVDKVNVAAIGNIVRQLHIHVVGRNETDFCWPNVVWGTEGGQSYTENELQEISAAIKEQLGEKLTLLTRRHNSSCIIQA